MNAQAASLGALLSALQEELERPVADRSTGASDSSLRLAVSLCSDAIIASQDGRSDLASQLAQRLARVAVDEWLLGSPLTAKTAECPDML